MSAPDVAVIGGGIVGCALAAFLAEGGARVRLFERAELGAGASGRNSGVLQHPLDEELAGLYEESLAEHGATHAVPDEPVGVLVLATDPALAAAECANAAARFPELRAETLDGRALAAAEPGLAPGLAACRLHTGRPLQPATAVRAFAARADAAGAELRTGAHAVPVVEDGRATGIEVDGERHPAGAVAVAAGPWTPALVSPDGDWRPVSAQWGVVADLRLERPPRHVLEEAGVAALTAQDGAPPAIFSLVTAGGVSALGSTFGERQPEPAALLPALRERGARFLPAAGTAAPLGLRACARPRSADGRPLLGPVDGIEGLVVATGHGPWGISLGPASARLVADGLLGAPANVPPAFDARRFGPVA